MINFVNDPEHDRFTAAASGSLGEIVSEIGLCINIAYNLIRSRNPAAGQHFQGALRFMLRPESPVWEKEDVQDSQDGVKFVHVVDLDKEVPHE